METQTYFSSPSHDSLAKEVRLRRSQNSICLTLGYPMLTIVTPLLTLLLLYVLFDCLDEDMCFKLDAPTKLRSNVTNFDMTQGNNSTATLSNDAVTPFQLTDAELRLICLLSLLFLSFFVAILLIFRLKKKNLITDEERTPILKD